MEFDLLTGLLVCLIFAAILVTWLILRYKHKMDILNAVEEAAKTRFVSKEQHHQVESAFQTVRQEKEIKESELREQSASIASKDQTILNLQEKLQSQKSEMDQFQEKFKAEFQHLANSILKQNSNEFAATNKKQIDDILTPLREKITGFEKRVNEVYTQETQQRSELKGEIKHLLELNQKISQEAKNLTTALKGDNKKQGNWGEVILEKVLERSGLEKGREYDTQVSDTAEDGRRIMPDVIIHLPEGKHIIIDSKVSLVSYEKFVSSEETEDKNQHLKLHVQSFKNHIKGLAEKNYTSAKNLNSPDFVLMFVPIESSFSAAIQADNELFHYAWERRIVIVSPSTLLATLNTVSSIWKREKQTKNALEIANKAGALYDKFVGFLDDMKKIDSSLKQSQKTYDLAMNKLTSGTGNLIKRTEDIRKLGIKTSKTISSDLIEKSNSDLLEHNMRPENITADEVIQSSDLFGS